MPSKTRTLEHRIVRLVYDQETVQPLKDRNIPASAFWDEQCRDAIALALRRVDAGQPFPTYEQLETHVNRAFSQWVRDEMTAPKKTLDHYADQLVLDFEARKIDDYIYRDVSDFVDYVNAGPMDDEARGKAVQMITDLAEKLRASDGVLRTFQETEDFVHEMRRERTKREVRRALEEQEQDLSGFETIDLSEALSSTPPSPVLLEREDGAFALYRGRTHTIGGEYESGKSWIWVLAAKQVLDAGGTVTILDWEDDEYTAAHRLHDLGVSTSLLNGSGKVRYLRPSARLNEAAWAKIEKVVKGSDLVVLDGTSDAMVMQGLNPFGGNDESSVVFARIMRRILEMEPNCAVLNIDHVSKSEGRGRHLIGSQAKGAGLSGVLLIVDKVVEPFGRGRVGRAEIWIAKDRPGGVRQHAGPMNDHRMQHWGDFVLDSSEPDLDAYIEPWSTATTRTRMTPMMQQVLDAMRDAWDRDGKPMSKNQIRLAVRGSKHSAKEEALGELWRQGYVETAEGPVKNGTYFKPVEVPVEVDE